MTLYLVDGYNYLHRSRIFAKLPLELARKRLAALTERVEIGTRVLVLSQYYTDDRGPDAGLARGAKIVADHALPRRAMPTVAKSAPEFNELVMQIRQEGFDPAYLRHVRDFNLRHPDAFQTLTPEEDGSPTHSVSSAPSPSGRTAE